MNTKFLLKQKERYDRLLKIIIFFFTTLVLELHKLF